MDLSMADWLAIAAIVVPLIAKVATDVASYLTQRHDSGLARIAGFAGREAATISNTIATLPAGADARTVEANLVASATASILTEMGNSASTVGADSAKISGIVTGELNKIRAPIAVAAAGPAPIAAVIVQP